MKIVKISGNVCIFKVFFVNLLFRVILQDGEHFMAITVEKLKQN